MPTTLSIAYTPKDALSAQKLLNDLPQLGYSLQETVFTGGKSLLILVLSPDALQDMSVMNKVFEASDHGQHIIPVSFKATPLPPMLGNLQTIDLTQKYDLTTLHERIEALLAPNAPMAVTFLTPARRRANMKIGAVLALFVVIVFATAIYGVGVLGIRAPQREYDAVETERVDLRNTIIAPTLDAFLPKSTGDAESFPLTVEALPTRLRPFISETATAQAPATPPQP